MATDLKFDVSALDSASKVFARMAKTVEKFEKRLEELDGKRVSADVEVNTSKAEREVGSFATKTRKTLEAALKALPDIEVDADSTPAQQELARLRGEMQELADKRIGIDIDAVDAIGRAKAIQEQLDEIQRRTPANIQVNADAAAAAAALGAITGEVDKLDGKTAHVKVDVDKSLSDSLIKLNQLGRALGSLALPAAAIAAAPQIAAIGAAALTASGALFLLPAAGAAAGVAIGTLAAGFKNFGDAVGDNPTKAAEALAKLAPEARETALAVRELATNWSTMQKAVQNALFQDTATMLQQLSGNYLPAVERTLTGVAKGFNAAAQETAKFLNAPSVVKDLSNALGDVEKATVNASGAMEPLTRAFVDLVAVGAERLPELGKGIADAAESFADFIDRARESGQLGEWIDNGIQALQQLGSIAGNVGSALGSIFKAADSAGADFLGTVDQLTERIATFLKSGEGQSALVSLFQDIRAGVDAATPGVEALVRAVSDVVRALGDAGVLEAAGRAFSAIAQEVAPLISGLAGLAPVIAGILDTAAALAPVLVPLAAGFVAMKLATAGLDKLAGLPGMLRGIAGGAGAADGKVGGFNGKLSTLQGIVAKGIAFGAIIQALDELSTNLAGGEDKLNGFTDGIHDLAGGMDQLATNPGSVFSEIGAELDKMVRHVTGFKFDPITIPAKGEWADFQAGYKAIVDQANRTNVEIPINGNPNKLGDVINQVLEAKRRGEVSIDIGGNTIPIDNALDYIIKTYELDDLMIPVNGKMTPLADAIRNAHTDAVNSNPLLLPIGGDTSPLNNDVHDGVGAALAALPPSDVPVGADTAPFGAGLAAAQGLADGAVGTMKLVGDPMPFEGTMYQIVQLANGQSATVQIGANGQPAMLEVNGVKYTIDATTGIMQLAANQDPALGVLNGTKLVFDAATGTMQLQANPAGALANLTTTVSLMNGATGTVTLDANGAPATAVLNGTKYTIDATTGVMTIDGNPAPGQEDLSGLKVAVDTATGTLTILGRDGGVQALKSNLSQPSSSTHTIYVRYQMTGDIPRSTPVGVSTPGRLATGGIIEAGGVRRFAHGGINRPEMYANGAMRKLRPADSKRAQIASRNSWRVFGDIPNKAEFYLPDDNEPRTVKIAKEWARRRGLTLGPTSPTTTATVSTDTATTSTSIRTASTRATGTQVGTRLADAGRNVSSAAGSAIASAITRQTATLSAKLTQLGDRLGNVERSVNISNSFSVPDSQRLADEVSRRQRTQAALGLFG